MALTKKQSILVAALIGLGFGLSFASLPKWADRELSMEANVVEVDSQSNLIVLDKGVSSNYRIGAYCDILSGKDEAPKTLVVIEATLDNSIALAMGDFEIKPADKLRLRLINK